MKRLRRWLSERPASVFVVVAFGFSWSLWIPMILSQRGVLPFRVPVNPLGSFGPAVGAVAAGWVSGRTTPRSLLHGLCAWRVGGRWYAFALLATLVAWLAGAAAHMLFAGPIPPFEHLERWYLVLPIAVLVLVLGGPLGEEIGWRGFLLPLLQERSSPLWASLLVAAVWFAWHVPAFWLEGAAQKGSSLAAFAAMVAVMSVLFTWMYNRTGGSLLLAVLFHTGVNTVSVCGGAVAPALDDSTPFALGFAAAFVVAALAVVSREGTGLGRDRVETAAPVR